MTAGLQIRFNRRFLSYRLGIDLGANSLGWCVLCLDSNLTPSRIIDMGVRVYPDGRNPKDKASLAVARRLARQQRRRRDRYLKRRARLMEKLVQHGLMPTTQADQKSLQALDPYVLRAKGLVEILPPHHFGRALFHLNQRRGFKSNRKIDKADEKETGKIKSAISGLRTSMQENNIRTVGQYLFAKRQAGQPVRARLQGEGVGAKYDLYLDRSMIADEFDALWSEQAKFHPELLREPPIKSVLWQSTNAP